ncbi:Starch-binding associating with outer membrane [Filimonas lacunae]|uniref:Starch-binding associating with outer membrane n=1 Tax=Filimonas lacunae TaxID=477680 RepID=A0A173MMM0_9BACT|nr:RagB/SusD family nutrient uptake outer membrane protein [Filimonas lacunae]BAV08893.1 outer membrane protein, nutrient binding [Filimonas lacunae]SIS63504.1 Starch-binding associating with outer membrane [Filimonas lacunae]
MKLNNIIQASLIAATLLAGGCQKKLEEKPYTVFTVDYFKTPSGLQNAVYALYSGMRFDYGPIGAVLIANSGTDEWTYGDQVTGGSELELGTYPLTSSNGHILTPWNRNFSNINLANAVIQFAPVVTLNAAVKTRLVAEAHFLRGLYYFLLVQQFGAVPLDLGMGELAFNQNPYQGFNRLPTAELFVKNYQTIIDDFTFASENLPDQRPAAAFYLSKAAALHMLTKAYIFRGYSAAKQSTDFGNAWTTAKKLLDNQATYGVSLLTNYADVHKEGNDYNAEILYSVERIPGDPIDNEVASPGSDFANKANISNNLFNCNYQNNVAIPANSGKYPVDRVIQYGRPLRQLCPNPYIYEVAFLDKVFDSRYDNTFRTVWLATNTNVAGINVGDTAYFIAPNQKYADSLTLLGTKKYRIIAPSEFYLPSRPAIQMFPNLKKYDDNKRGTANDVSGRPFVVSKLSEVYLLAAEAAIQEGRKGDALPLILTLRKRAAYRSGLDSATISNRQKIMAKINKGTVAAPVWVDLTTDDMTLDFIMDERTRELCGESVRWPDLACRNLLYDRVKKYNTAATNKVRVLDVLRPIPQTQLDAMNDPDKAKYQNTGY